MYQTPVAHRDNPYLLHKQINRLDPQLPPSSPQCRLLPVWLCLETNWVQMGIPRWRWFRFIISWEITIHNENLQVQLVENVVPQQFSWTWNCWMIYRKNTVDLSLRMHTQEIHGNTTWTHKKLVWIVFKRVMYLWGRASDKGQLNLNSKKVAPSYHLGIYIEYVWNQL